MLRLRTSVLLLPFLLVACQSDDAPAPAAESGPVSVEALQGLFPDMVRNLEQASVGGELEGALGFQVSRAVARFGALEVENRPLVVVAVMDTGSAEMAENMGFGWGVASATAPQAGRATLSQLSMEPTTLDGHPARRTTDPDARRKNLEVLVDERFYIEVHGILVDDGVLDDAVRSLDLERLAELAE